MCGILHFPFPAFHGILLYSNLFKYMFTLGTNNKKFINFQVLFLPSSLIINYAAIHLRGPSKRPNSKDSDKPAHLCRLVISFAVGIHNVWPNKTYGLRINAETDWNKMKVGLILSRRLCSTDPLRTLQLSSFHPKHKNKSGVVNRCWRFYFYKSLNCVSTWCNTYV